MPVDEIRPVIEVFFPDGRSPIVERRRGDPLRRYRPPQSPMAAERRRQPRRNDPDVRGRRLDLLV